jgi:hypothetical protein
VFFDPEKVDSQNRSTEIRPSIGVPPQLSIYAMGLHVGRSLAA